MVLKHVPVGSLFKGPIRPICKNREIFERFLENKIELISMFPLI